MTTTEFIQFLMERFHIEWKRRDRSGVYGLTQRLLAYNSNKIEGSTLTEEQTASLFDTGTLPKSDDYYLAKYVEEMNGHFLMSVSYTHLDVYKRQLYNIIIVNSLRN